MNAEHIKAKVALVFTAIAEEGAPDKPEKFYGKDDEARYIASVTEYKKKALVMGNVGELVAQLLVDLHRIADAAERTSK